MAASAARQGGAAEAKSPRSGDRRPLGPAGSAPRLRPRSAGPISSADRPGSAWMTRSARPPRLGRDEPDRSGVSSGQAGSIPGSIRWTARQGVWPGSAWMSDRSGGQHVRESGGLAAVGAERPAVALGIADGEVPGAAVGLVQVHQDLGPGLRGTGVQAVGVVVTT